MSPHNGRKLQQVHRFPAYPRVDAAETGVGRGPNAHQYPVSTTRLLAFAFAVADARQVARKAQAGQSILGAYLRQHGVTLAFTVLNQGVGAAKTCGQRNSNYCQGNQYLYQREPGHVGGLYTMEV
jgi:hypothetical protein